MQIILSIIFPFFCISRLSVKECLFGRSNSHCNSKYAMLFYIVVFLFIFFPFSIKADETVPLQNTLQVTNKNIFCHCVFIEYTKERHIETNIFSFETVFDEMDKGLLKVRVFFFKFLSSGFNFVVADSNESSDKKGNNTQGGFRMTTDCENNKLEETHEQFDDDLETFWIILFPSIIFQIVWHIVNYIYAQHLFLSLFYICKHYIRIGVISQSIYSIKSFKIY
jgi:hypothetical protein